METPADNSKFLVFDDDELMQVCWTMMAKQQGISNLRVFKDWEQFSAMTHDFAINECVAFVDFTFNNSDFNGSHIARELRNAGAKKIYLTSGYTSLAPEITNLFDQVLKKNIPSDIKAYS